MIDIEKFIWMYQNKYGNLNTSQHDGLTNLLTFINADPNMNNRQHIAYCLATTKHECADTWLPIAEYGKGKGRKYGIPDAAGRIFYGRGFVQLTWDTNYISLGKALGVDLHGNPDLAMDPQIAYQIMSYGMRKGAFTGASLAKYINSEKCDYINARRIINALDCAAKIAGYAVELEIIIKQCEVTK